MQINKFYRRIIQFLTKNNEEKKELIQKNEMLQKEVCSLSFRNVSVCNTLNCEMYEKMKVQLELDKLKIKQKYIDAKEALIEAAKEIKNIESEVE